MEMNWMTKVLMMTLNYWLVCVVGNDCPSVQIMSPYYVQNDVTCNEQGTLIFNVFEDCPTEEPIFKLTSGFEIKDDCDGLIYSSGLEFGFKKVGDAESSSANHSICTSLLQNITDPTSDINFCIFQFIDVDEFPPEPAEGLGIAQAVYVDENTRGNIYNFSYTDKDADETSTLVCTYGGQTFENEAWDLFEIVPVGQEEDVFRYSLNAKRSLDFETNSFFSLQAKFESHDSRGNKSSVEQSFLVFVQDVGDNPPFFTMATPYVEVPEGTPPDSFVFSVEAKDRDVVIDNKIFYSIISGNDEGYFKIDGSSGKTFIANQIDRESLGSSLFNLEIEAIEVDQDGTTPIPDQGNTSQVTNVKILDVNDNIPRFDRDSYSTPFIEFDETNPSSKQNLDLLITVTDMDEDLSGKYDLTVDNPNVSLSPTSGSGETTFTVTLLNSEDFNYEAHADKPLIIITITATEIANATHVSTAILNISLVDRNDRIPTFENNEYISDANETLASGSLIATVTATDDDASPQFSDQYLLYSLTSCIELIINQWTGDIYLSELATLNYEDKKEINCLLKVSDMNGTSKDTLRSEQIPFTLKIIDVNDEAPSFINFDGSQSISENSPEGTLVSDIHVSDPDTSASLVLSLEYPNNPGSQIESWFTLRESPEASGDDYVGSIVVTSPPDYEVASDVTVNIIARDVKTEIGEPQILRTLSIEILDVNDVTPNFNDDYSAFDYNENLPKYTVINIVQATDPDTEDELTYSLVDDLGYLEIDETSGEVWVVTLVDRENISSFQVFISVTDLANNTQSVTSMVTINDENDNSPHLNEVICAYAYSVYENATDGDVLTTVKATDADEGLHATIIYVIKNINSIGYVYQYAPFVIDQETGQVTVNASGDRILDREQYTEVQLIIDAFDQCEPSEPFCKVNSDECILSVSVEDVNDNSPGNYELNHGAPIITDEFLMQGELIGDTEISCLDPDEPNTLSSNVTFEVVQMWLQDKPLFSLLFEALSNHRTGTNGIDEYYCNLKAVKDLTTLRGEYILQIQGSDSGTPPTDPSVHNFTLIIEDANDMIPYFEYSDCLANNFLTITMSENITDLFTPLSCSSDDDMPRDADIFVKDDDDPQSKNSEVVLTYLKEESIALDGNTDNQLDAFYIYEYTDKGRYAIAISKPIDRERGSRYILILEAKDKGDVPQTNLTSIFIIVKDYSEYPPIFCEQTQCDQTLYIKENTDDPVAFMEATDKDNGEDQINDIIYYYIIYSDIPVFQIPNDTLPRITPIAPLDREQTGTYELRILASNSVTGLPPDGIQNTNRVLYIYVVVLDQNDEYPIHAHVIYGDFLDTGNKGDQVALLEFVDQDLNDTLVYTFGSSFVWNEGQNYTDPFKIVVNDSRVSEIVLNMDPKGKYGYCSFTVVANDEAHHNSSAVVEVFVVTNSYIVIFYFMNNVDDVQRNKQFIEDIFTNVFNYTCIIDSIDKAVDSNNVEINGQSVVSAHFIREIQPTDTEIDLIRNNNNNNNKNKNKDNTQKTFSGELISPTHVQEDKMKDVHWDDAKGGTPTEKEPVGDITHQKFTPTEQEPVGDITHQKFTRESESEFETNMRTEKNQFNSLTIPLLNGYTKYLSDRKHEAQIVRLDIQKETDVQKEEEREEGKSEEEVEYELVAKEEIEDEGSKGTVTGSLRSQLEPLGLYLIQIGDTSVDISKSLEQQITNLKISLGAITLFLMLFICLLVFLFVARTLK